MFGDQVGHVTKKSDESLLTGTVRHEDIFVYIDRAFPLSLLRVSFEFHFWVWISEVLCHSVNRAASYWTLFALKRVLFQVVCLPEWRPCLFLNRFADWTLQPVLIQTFTIVSNRLSDKLWSQRFRFHRFHCPRPSDRFSQLHHYKLNERKFV